MGSINRVDRYSAGAKEQISVAASTMHLKSDALQSSILNLDAMSNVMNKM